MKFLKEHWKVILIVILSILFVSKCSSTGNYKRKLNKQIARTEYVKDSLTNLYSNSAEHIDSLTFVIKDLNKDNNYMSEKIDNLESQVKFLKEQNRKLANRTIVVDIKEKEKEKVNESESSK